MADFKKLADEAAAKAALERVKGAARRALDDLTLTDEEKALRAAEQEKESRIRKWKWIAGGVVAVLVFLAVMSILAKLWAWFVGLAILAGIAYAIYFYLRPKVKAVQVRAVAQIEAHRAEEEQADAAAEAERTREAERAAKAAREQAIDDELAALKARTKKS